MTSRLARVREVGAAGRWLAVLVTLRPSGSAQAVADPSVSVVNAGGLTGTHGEPVAGLVLHQSGQLGAGCVMAGTLAQPTVRHGSNGAPTVAGSGPAPGTTCKPSHTIGARSGSGGSVGSALADTGSPPDGGVAAGGLGNPTARSAPLFRRAGRIRVG
jgi:hypothetical protein